MKLLDLIFPRRCPICDQPVPIGDNLICSKCRTKIKYISEPKCKKCGKELKDETKVRPDGVAYKEVPLIVTKIFNDKTANKPVNDKSNKSIKEKVEKMFYQGMQVDDIAAELSCSISEIQFIIDML